MRQKYIILPFTLLPDIKIITCTQHTISYASMADDIVELHSLENSLAMKVSPVVPPGT